VVAAEMPNSASTAGRSYNSIKYLSRTLLSFKKELITSNILKVLLKHEGVSAVYVVNKKGENTKFVVETPTVPEKFYCFEGNKVLRNDVSVEVRQVTSQFQDELRVKL
jgi:hypothetical protein